MKIFVLSLTLLLPALPVLAKNSFLDYLVQTADRGEAESQFVLGLVSHDGWEGSIKPGSIAEKWRNLATEMDDRRSALVLGLLQREDGRVAQNRDEAMKLLGLSAGQGDNYARVILGDMLLEGDGVPVDWSRGAEWIRKSASEGFAPAQFRLGLIYLIGDKTTPKDEIEALAWFIVAADAGSKLAQEYRDERTQLMGREAAREAIRRSRTLLIKAGESKKDHQSPMALNG